jgi:ribosomal protein S27E
MEGGVSPVISIGLGQLITLVMLIGVSLVCLLWFHSFWREQRREARRRRIAIQCRICGCNYAIPPRAERVTRCPSCGNLNERGGLPQI